MFNNSAAIKIKKGVSSVLDLPKEIVLNLPLVTLVGNEDLSIENYKGVIEFTDEKVRLSSSAGIIKIEGKGLYLKKITAENILLGGKIIKFEYLT